MTTLHLVRCSAFKSHTINNCLSVLGGEDMVILLDDGVYNLQHPVLQQFQTVIPDSNLLVIQQHALARGVKLMSEHQAIELSELIKLSLETAQSITWQ